MRIIAGRWRGRRLPVPAGARPTPDRIRETLFNWLAPLVEGARCLDPFAGSGVLGFEAASRGAARVVLLERDPERARALRRQAERLEAGAVEVVIAEALAWLRAPGERFDVVFLDPPFGQGLLPECCAAVAEAGRLAPGALVYLEGEPGTWPPALPPGLALVRDGRAGRVRFALAAAGPGEAESLS